MNGRYYSLNEYLQKQFGEKVYKLALDGGMTCPNRDGTLDTRGCIFCSAGGSGDFAEPSTDSIAEQIERAKRRIADKTSAKKFIAYFQSYTNTYAPVARLRQLFTQAIMQPEIAALSVATRPDCLPPEVLDLLSELNAKKPVFVELGLQTVHERTAQFIRRRYPLSVFDEAVRNLRAIGVHIVVHAILGLPFETKEQMLETVRYIGTCGAHGIKLQLLHVLRGTDLEPLYESGTFRTLESDEYIDLLCECLERLPPQIVIHRLTGDAPKKLLIAPL